ncbi:hypothetical protein ACIPIC_02680 [Streptomyces collinus]|uniref:hypothetical protein n=1 Tax=Streptomyces collinus TaxID=42684 RepID=UPI00380D2119
MTAELARLGAAQAKADALAASVGDWDGVGPRLLVPIIDPETNTRLATCFVSYCVDGAARPLRLVEESS